MKNAAVAFVLLSVGACSDGFDARYATFAEAQQAGAVDRGWVPRFVPSSATDISESHDLDTNRQTLRFTIPPSQISSMVQGLNDIDDPAAAMKLSARTGFGPAAEVYLVCSGPVPGALAVDRKSGRVAYDTTAEWAADICVKGQ